jgi:hypothetical protein
MRPQTHARVGMAAVIVQDGIAFGGRMCVPRAFGLVSGFALEFCVVIVSGTPSSVAAASLAGQEFGQGGVTHIRCSNHDR